LHWKILTDFIKDLDFEIKDHAVLMFLKLTNDSFHK